MFRQITSIAGPHFGEIRNIKPPLSGSIIVNSIIDFGKHTDQLGIRRANENGIVGYNLYEAKHSLAAQNQTLPKVTAASSDPSVKIKVTQATELPGSASVDFDYKGIVKTYRVVFE